MKRSAVVASALIALASCSSPAKPVTEPTGPIDMPKQTTDEKPTVADGPKNTPPQQAEYIGPGGDDPYRWLEDVEGDKALAWARERNAKSEGEISAQPGFQKTRDRIRSILDSKEKTPYVTKRGKEYWNFWQDDQNTRGVIRKTTLAEYKKKSTKWETILDIDALAAAEKENWVYAGNTCLYPTYDRCLISLSRGGGDAHVVREFDPTTKQFVGDGFVLPEAKSDVAWKDKDTIYVGTDFGPGSLTTSGYPRIVKEWKRGTKLAEAKTVFEGKDTDVAAGASRTWDHGETYDWVARTPTFFTSEQFLRKADGTLVKIEIPDDAGASVWAKQIYVQLRSDWKIGDKTWPRGGVIAMPFADFLAGKREFTALFEPSPTTSLDSIAELKSALVINVLEDVKNRLYTWTVDKKGKWTKKPFPAAKIGTVSVGPVEPAGDSDEYWLTESNYLSPTTLALGKLGGAKAEKLKTSPTFFDAKGLTVEQHFAKSKDGTRVPYFQVSRTKLELDGSNPTLLYGYGGFEVSLTPGYDPLSGSAWDERGGVYVVANIRGGGEYGPSWHQAALRHDRQKAYDDFIAVAQDLIARKVTSNQKLGIMGGSNCGLLMGVMLTERPDLFGAIVCQVPLLDMSRYHKLLAGASWMEEYGDPDKAEDWAVLKTFSPYQNVKKGTKYPRTLFTSSTRDDRVHPGHARKMVARMLEQGHDVLYYENIEGGHGGAANHEQVAFMQALEWTFLAKQLGLADK
ncbi:prolyl oligopeptidase family serine peptidase [soil metagenome]